MTNAAIGARPSGRLTAGDWLIAHWFAVFLAVYGLWVWLPWLAPVFMRIGWSEPGRALYLIYSLFCHQLPERSFFLFGRMPMYPLTDIQAAWQSTINPMVLRQFIGNQTMGWKIAWSDRMISFYTSIWLFGLIWWLLRRKVKPLPWWGFVLFLLPIILDGGTHAISDFSGIGQGFRDSNQWLVMLTNGNLPALFYAGDTVGSLNSSLRLITGLLAGFGVVWFAMPHVEASFAQS
jgi:uncharacterized membrane protein